MATKSDNLGYSLDHKRIFGLGELRYSYDDEWMADLQAIYTNSGKRKPRPGSVLQEAMGLYLWALRERARGRYIVSMNEDMTTPIRLFMPSIEDVAPPQQDAKPLSADQSTIKKLVAS